MKRMPLIAAASLVSISLEETRTKLRERGYVN